MSERSSRGALRRLPVAHRMRLASNVIADASPDVLCLQDSSTEFASLLSSSFELLTQTRNGKSGFIQVFSKRNGNWKLRALPQFSFATVEMSSGETIPPLRLTSFDLSYRGKGLAVPGIESDGLNKGPFTFQNPRVAGQMDLHRRVAVGHLVNAVAPHIMVGNSFMGRTERFSSQYIDAWEAAGCDQAHERTSNTLPMRLSNNEIVEKTNFFYFSSPGYDAGRVKEQHGERFLLPHDFHNSPVVTASSGRYQRCFLRQCGLQAPRFLGMFSRMSVAVPRYFEEIPVDGLSQSAPISCSDQFPLLVLMTV